MFLKKFTPITPSRRFFQILQTYEKTKIKQKHFYFFKKFHVWEKTNQGQINNRGYRRKFNQKMIFTNQKLWKNFPYVCTSLYTTLTKKKKYGVFSTIYNFLTILPVTQLVLPGRIQILQYAEELSLTFFLLMHIILPLDYVPYNYPISYLKCTNNSKWTFTKSTGTCSYKYYAVKISKFEMVELASKTTKYLPKTIQCLLGGLPSLGVKYLILKSAHSPFKTKVKTIVRGVAMNPVDHPNGGRTKAKQPEKTPWGRIAKHNK